MPAKNTTTTTTTKTATATATTIAHFNDFCRVAVTETCLLQQKPTIYLRFVQDLSEIASTNITSTNMADKRSLPNSN